MEFDSPTSLITVSLLLITQFKRGSCLAYGDVHGVVHGDVWNISVKNQVYYKVGLEVGHNEIIKTEQALTVGHVWFMVWIML